MGDHGRNPMRGGRLAPLLVLACMAVWAPAAHAVSFSGPTNFATGNFPQSVAVGDFNGDSDPDLAVVNQHANKRLDPARRRRAGASRRRPTSPSALTPLSLAVGDFNGDSDPDLAVANEGSNNVSILLGGAGGSFTAPTNFAVGTQPQTRSRSATSTATPTPTWRSRTRARATSRSCSAAPAGASAAPTNFGVGGLPRVGRGRRLQRRLRPRPGGRERSAPTTSRSCSAPPAGASPGRPTSPSAASPTSVAVGRLQRRLRPGPGGRERDSATTSRSCSAAPAGSFTGPPTPPSATSPTRSRWATSTATRDPDLAVANQASDDVSVLLGGAGGRFLGPTNFAAGDGPSSVAVGDFNGDARPGPRGHQRAGRQRLDPARNDPRRLSTPRGRDAVQDRCSSPPTTRAPGQREPDPRAAARTPVVQPAGSELRLRDDRLAGCELEAPPSSRWARCAVRSGTVPDITLEASITDVRNKSGLADYAGELQARVTLRITDKANGASLTESGTLGDRTFAFTLPCSPTGGAANVGSTCSVQTGANAVFQGIVQAGKRAIWQMSQAEVLDGGPDGDVDTPTGNTVFARQGSSFRRRVGAADSRRGAALRITWYYRYCPQTPGQAALRVIASRRAGASSPSPRRCRWRPARQA